MKNILKKLMMYPREEEIWMAMSLSFYKSAALLSKVFVALTTDQ